jgi:CheY-like chemotaxis protein
MNILILDDEPVSSAVLKQLVTKLPDCDAHAFTDPAAALIWCSCNALHLAIVDYAMPAMDGIEFVQRLRALPRASNVPVIMVSAVADTQVVRRALRNGVHDFIHKPFDFMELQTCVSEILGLRAMRGQLANKTLLTSARALGKPKGSVPRLMDRDLSRARLGGNQELLGELARIFTDTVPGMLRVIHTCIVNGDFEGVLANVISLKGAVASIEAPDVLHFLSILERHARERHRIATVAAFSMVQALTAHLLDELAALRVDTSEVIGSESKNNANAPESPTSARWEYRTAH